MKNFFEKIKSFFLNSLEHEPWAMVSPIQIIKTRKGIIRELLTSKKNGNILGIYSPVLGPGMFLTGVDDFFIIEKEEIVVLKPYDMNGILLHRNHISIEEILSVCPFSSMYTNPKPQKNRQKEYVLAN